MPVNGELHRQHMDNPRLGDEYHRTGPHIFRMSLRKTWSSSFSSTRYTPAFRNLSDFHTESPSSLHGNSTVNYSTVQSCAVPCYDSIHLWL